MTLTSQIERCSTWDDYVSKIPDSGFIFRGQSDEHDHLRSSLERCLGAIPPGERWKHEASLLREFKRRACHYLDDPPASHDHLEWLALMRHHGAPTRLLDFSYSGHVAAFFALSEARAAKRPTAAAVWQIDLNWLNAVFRTHHPGPFIDFHEPGMFAMHLLCPSHGQSVPATPCVAAVNPYRMNERLTIQQGLFLCPTDVSIAFEDNLRAMGTPMPITKYVFEPGCHRQALGALRMMNIPFATLYPGLEGFSRSLWHRVDDRLDTHGVDDSVLLKEVLYQGP